MDNYINWVIKPTDMKLKIKEKDLEILNTIYSNSRISLKDIGKKLNLSKVAVMNRIKNLEKKKIIIGYSCLINFIGLGLKIYQVGIKTNMSTIEKEEYTKKLQECEFINNILRFSGGKWDFLIRFISDENSINKVLDILLDQNILEMNILEINEVIFMRGENKELEYIKKSDNYSLNKNEIIILNELAKNSRKKIIDISEKLKLSPKTVTNNIKILKEKNIILSFPTEFNPYIINNETYILLVTTKNRHIQENIAKVISKIKSQGVLINIQEPNIISAHTLSSLEDIKKIEKNLEPFINEIRNYEFMKVEEQSYYNFLPEGVLNLLNKKLDSVVK